MIKPTSTDQSPEANQNNIENDENCTEAEDELTCTKGKLHIYIDVL